MKKIYFQTMTLLLGIILATSSCNKDPLPSNPGTNNPPAAQLKKIEQDANNFAALDYNSQSLLSKFVLVNESLRIEAGFVYGADKKPTQGKTEGYILNFKYTAGLLNKVEYVPEMSTDNKVESYAQFSYQNNRLSQTIVYTLQENSYIPGLKITCEYYTNGDVKSMTHSYLAALPDQYSLVDKTVYEYDTKTNPLRAANEVFYALYMNHSVHNITKETFYDHQNQLDETRSYSFTYNSAGLPATCVENIAYPDSPGINKNIKYVYE